MTAATAGVDENVAGKKEGHEAASEERAKVAAGETAVAVVPLTLEEKEAAINTRAEERRSAVRREALGWDRYAQCALCFVWWKKCDSLVCARAFFFPEWKGSRSSTLSIMCDTGEAFIFFYFFIP